MSTRPDSRLVFVEFPDFGYGPAAAAVTLVSELVHKYPWRIVSTGNAAAFAEAQLPEVPHNDVETFHREGWERFRAIAPSGSVVLSVTNPDFAGWAVEAGYTVGVVDTLDWMWNALPVALGRARFRLIQAFFTRASLAGGRGVEVVQPLVDRTLWPPIPAARRPGTAVIGFGGMHLPFDPDLVARYTSWFLDAALPVLLEAGVGRVIVAGGRADLSRLAGTWAGHPAMTIHPRLSRAPFADLARSAEHLLLTPGLGSIYECAASGLTPFLQPGFNLSMALQSLQVERLGYEHVCAWPWLGEVSSRLAQLSEHDGVQYLAGRIRRTIDDAGSERFVREALRGYVGRRHASPLVAPVPSDLPTASERVVAHLDGLL
jgi:hypothetical protein